MITSFALSHAIVSLVAMFMLSLLAIGSIECGWNGCIKMQRILSFTEQFHYWIVHLQIQFAQANIEIQFRLFHTIDVQRHRIVMELECQRSDNRRFIDIGHIEMLRMDD